jgi:Clp amino terminal domain, pathogenicity island component
MTLRARTEQRSKHTSKQRSPPPTERSSPSNASARLRALACGANLRHVDEGLADRGRAVIANAREAARAHNHNYLGTEHILLGLARENDGIAARLLESGGDYQTIRSELLRRFPGVLPKLIADAHGAELLSAAGTRASGATGDRARFRDRTQARSNNHSSPPRSERISQMTSSSDPDGACVNVTAACRERNARPGKSSPSTRFSTTFATRQKRNRASAIAQAATSALESLEEARLEHQLALAYHDLGGASLPCGHQERARRRARVQRIYELYEQLALTSEPHTDERRAER